ncbi:UDP-2,3-diacylglucosamine diphosphatase [Marinospirillum sp. MEB164]|uniref:UDP-2,3-diacylglucosamine hydrolase n=1 Tax=Marinospirillum alkalitolerans TaxID=3123374 RepID=A0ABW8PXY9_9GAMM
MQLFIADLHLQEDRPEMTQGFLRFLATEARCADALYILGDFFNVWVGDDGMEPYHHQLAAAMQALSDHGTKIYLMHGNRDFTIGSRFCALAGCQLLGDLERIDTDSPDPILLQHGDLLCTDDLGYQRLRRFFRQPVINFILRNLPLSWRQRIGRTTRQASKSKTRTKPVRIIDVNQQAVEQVMLEHQVRRMIHGHTHRPQVHHFLLTATEPAQAAERWVLGDWNDQQGWLIRKQGSHLSLESFQFQDL